METLTVEEPPVAKISTPVEPTNEAREDRQLENESVSPTTCDRMGTAACNLACGNVACPVWAIRPQARNEEKPSPESAPENDSNKPPHEDTNASPEEDSIKPRSYADQLADDKTNVVTAHWKAAPKTSAQVDPSETKPEQAPTSVPTNDQERTEFQPKPQKVNSSTETSQPQQVSKPAAKTTQMNPKVTVSKTAASLETVSSSVEESTQPQQPNPTTIAPTEKPVVAPKVSESHQPSIAKISESRATVENRSEQRATTHRAEKATVSDTSDTAPELTATDGQTESTHDSAPRNQKPELEQTATKPDTQPRTQAAQSEAGGDAIPAAETSSSRTLKPETVAKKTTAIRNTGSPAIAEATNETHDGTFSDEEAQPSYDEPTKEQTTATEAIASPTQPDTEVMPQPVAQESTPNISDTDKIIAEPVDFFTEENQPTTNITSPDEQTNDTLVEIEPAEDTLPRTPLENSIFPEQEFVGQLLDDEIPDTDETLPIIDIIDSEASTTVEQEPSESNEVINEQPVDSEPASTLYNQPVLHDDLDTTEPTETTAFEDTDDIPPAEQVFAEAAHDIAQQIDATDSTENSEHLLAADVYEEPPCPYRLVNENPDEEVVEPDEAAVQTALEAVIANETGYEPDTAFIDDDSFDVTARQPSHSSGIRSISDIARRLIGQIAYILAA